MTPTLVDLQAAKIKNPEKWLDAIVQTCQEFEINTPQRVAAFLAQTSHESGGYTMLSENLNYKAATLAACWPNRFAVQEPDPNKPGKTRAKKDAITGTLGDALKLSLTAPPTEGRANGAVIEFLAEVLRLPRSSVLPSTTTLRPAFLRRNAA